MKWTYYEIENKTDQYGSHLRSVKKTTREKAIANSSNGGCDCAGVSTGAYRASTASVSTVRALMEEGNLIWSGGSPSRAIKDGITIECVA